MTAAHLVSEETTQSISTLDLRDLLADPATTIVDVRPLAAYNGWRLRGEARGGHIPGAVSFPIAWLESVEPAEVQKLLGVKGVLGRGTIVVYGYGAADGRALRTRLEELGESDVRLYASGWAAW